MASNYTRNYNLCQWAAEDKVLRTEFNADNSKIDAAINAVDSRVDGLASTVSGKASVSALEALKTTLNQQTAALSGKGDCQLYTTSYTGSNTFGAEGPCSLTFPKKPALVFISQGLYRLIMVQGQARSWSEEYTGNRADVRITWSGNRVQWHAGHATGQLNIANIAYQVIAILQAG